MTYHRQEDNVVIIIRIDEYMLRTGIDEAIPIVFVICYSSRILISNEASADKGSVLIGIDSVIVEVGLITIECIDDEIHLSLNRIGFFLIIRVNATACRYEINAFINQYVKRRTQIVQLNDLILENLQSRLYGREHDEVAKLGIIYG